MKPSLKRLRQLTHIYEHICEEFGYSKYYDWMPELLVYHDPEESWGGGIALGCFDEDLEEISINLANHRTLKNVIKTMLHEYCHYLQCPGWYTRYAGMYSYEQHPYEIEAWEFAEKHIDEIYAWGQRV